MNSVEQILDFAIQREQEAHDFYIGLARKMERPGMGEVFTQFAGEELGHRRKLEAVKQGKRLLAAQEKVLDLKLAEYLVSVDPGEDLDYQKALIVAMKREKAAFKLYTDLAAGVAEQELKQIFLGLAQEEARHKLRFEVEYDDVILAEN